MRQIDGIPGVQPRFGNLLAALAELAEMTIAEFSAAFTAAFGTTPYQFVLDRRIHRAKKLLATTEMSITDIGMDVGFSTPSHFATTFKTA